MDAFNGLEISVMAKKLSPKIGFNSDAKQVLTGILKRAIELIRSDVITDSTDMGIVAAHLGDFCCYLDCKGTCDSDGFFGGLNGDTTWPALCEQLQESSDLEWHRILEDHLSCNKWPKPVIEKAETISIEAKPEQLTA